MSYEEEDTGCICMLYMGIDTTLYGRALQMQHHLIHCFTLNKLPPPPFLRLQVPTDLQSLLDCQ